MTDIFHEVEEDYRRERYEKLARHYGPYALAGIIGLLALTGGYQGYKSYRTHKTEAEAAAYMAAAGQLAKDPKAAAQAFSQIAGEGGGYGVIARFREAEALEAAGNTGGAVALLDQIAGGRGRDKALSDLALLKTGYLLLDRASRADLEKRLAPLTGDGNPWRAEAREILAFSALKSGEEAKARGEFDALAHDPASPEALRARAESMAAELSGPSAKPQNAGAAPAPVSPRAKESQ